MPRVPVDNQTADQPADPRAAMLARIYGLMRWMAAAVAVCVAIWLISDVLMVVFAATLMAVILHGTSDLLHRKTGLPYWAAMLTVVVVTVAALAGLGALAGPGLVAQVGALRAALGNQLHTLHDRVAQYSWGRSMLNEVPATFGGNKQSGGPPSVPSGFAGSVAGFFGSVLGVFGTVAVVVIAALYLAASPAIYVNGLLRLVPVAHRHRAKLLLQEAAHALLAWSAGQALDMLVVGILSGVGLWILGVPLALVLGVVAALFNFVPYIGAIVGSIPAILLAFSVGVSTGLETIALYLVIQGFEGNVMAPLIQKRAVDLPPGLTILSQTAFGTILGVPGLIFATPMTAALLAVLHKATPELDEADRI